MSGIMVFHVTAPAMPVFVQYISNCDFSADARSAGDLAPESTAFIPENASPTGRPLLVVAHEVSGSTSVYAISAGREW